MKGRVHSIQTLGTVDGPGIRAVVFMQGCPLRCVYCHNPDTWDKAGGDEVTSESVAKKILRLKNFYLKGGVTVSGGEPLMQGAFVKDLFEIMHENGLHTALDTSGVGTDENIELALKHTDLVLCDLKFPTDALYRAHTGASLKSVLAFLEKAADKNIPLWIRHVVVPGLTDSEESISEIVRIAKSFHTLQKIELLPFKKMCLSKYEKLSIPFPLVNTPECGKDIIERLERLL
ncbi:MAG: pyruvate formate lyase-activating protein [Clostridia bacterium]|nr:pyruvate formate lyase-activating protein [Clostridia bacterium]